MQDQEIKIQIQDQEQQEQQQNQEKKETTMDTIKEQYRYDYDDEYDDDDVFDEPEEKTDKQKISELNFASFTKGELLDIIREAQKELYLRGESKEKPKILESEKPKSLKDLYNELPGGFEAIQPDTRSSRNWAKKVKGIDRSITNGYSILGNFIDFEKPLYWYDNDIILNCAEVGGTRRNPEKLYTLFTIKNGKLEQVAQVQGSKSWAVNLWDDIEKLLAQQY